jgi:hypothetical protein
LQKCVNDEPDLPAAPSAYRLKSAVHDGVKHAQQEEREESLGDVRGQAGRGFRSNRLRLALRDSILVLAEESARVEVSENRFAGRMI